MPQRVIGKYKVHTFAPPPRGFDPFSATARELQRHGLPRRPDPATEAEASLTWVRAMRTLRDRQFTYVVPELEEQPDRFHGPIKRVTDASRGLVNGTSHGWSGTVAFVDPKVDPFAWVYAEWTVPNAYSPNPGDGHTYYSSAWIGIDGDNSPDVLQAGTSTEVTGAAAAISYAWMEWYPAPSAKIANFPFAPGDAARLLICATGPSTASCYFTNLTSLAYSSFTLTAPAGTTLVGNCAEAVVERPGLGFWGVLAQLPRFGEAFFDAASARTKSGAIVNLGTGTTVSMVADDGVTVISTPEIVDADAIRLYYTGP